MNKTMKIVLAGGAALVVGGFVAYQFWLKPQAENWITEELARTKIEVEARGDGSIFEYGEVEVKGVSAVINDIRYLDGELGLDTVIARLTVSGVNGHINNLEAENTQFSAEGLGAPFLVEHYQVKDLTYPEDMHFDEVFGIENISFAEMSAKNATGAIDDSVGVAYEFSLASGEITGFENQTADEVTVEGFEMRFFVDDLEEPFVAYLENYSMNDLDYAPFLALLEGDMSALSKPYYRSYQVEDFGVFYGDLKFAEGSGKGEILKVNEAGYPLASLGESKVDFFISKADYEALLANDETPEIKAIREEIEGDEYRLNMKIGYGLSEDKRYIANMSYTAPSLGALAVEIDLREFDSQKFAELMARVNEMSMEGANDEAVGMMVLAALQELSLGGLSVDYTDEGLADVLLTLDPATNAESLSVVAPIMIMGALSTEPAFAEELSTAVTDFLAGTKRFTLKAQPEAPVAVQQLMLLGMMGQPMAATLGLSASGE